MNIAGWSSLVARRAHNPKVVGSNPSPATLRDHLTVIFFYAEINGVIPTNDMTNRKQTPYAKHLNTFI